MDDVVVLFRYTDHAFGLTGWGMVWLIFLASLISRS